MPPRDVVGGRVWLDVALEVDVVALLDGLRVQAGPELQNGHGNVWNDEYTINYNSELLL